MSLTHTLFNFSWNTVVGRQQSCLCFLVVKESEFISVTQPGRTFLQSMAASQCSAQVLGETLKPSQLQPCLLSLWAQT